MKALGLALPLLLVSRGSFDTLLHSLAISLVVVRLAQASLHRIKWRPRNSLILTPQRHCSTSQDMPKAARHPRLSSEPTDFLGNPIHHHYIPLRLRRVLPTSAPEEMQFPRILTPAEQFCSNLLSGDYHTQLVDSTSCGEQDLLLQLYTESFTVRLIRIAASVASRDLPLRLETERRNVARSVHIHSVSPYRGTPHDLRYPHHPS